VVTVPNRTNQGSRVHAAQIHQVAARLQRYKLQDEACAPARLGLDSLELRRLHQDLIYTYKVVFCLTDDTSRVFLMRLSSGHMTRGHVIINYILVSVALTCGNSFLVNEW